MSVDSATTQGRRKRLPDGIRQLPNMRYQARISVTKNGHSTQVSVGTFTSLAAAKDARSLALAQRRSGAYIDRSDRRMTVRDWTVQWVAARPSTNRTVRSTLQARILPAWGDVKLEEVTTLGLQMWVNAMVADGLAPASVRDYYGVMKQMLRSAVTFGKLATTPAGDRAVQLPKESDPDPVVLSPETMALLEANAPARFRALIHLGCWAGLRIGELIALRWTDVDLAGAVVHVRQARKHDGTIGAPKNGKARQVPIAPATAAVLTAHRRDFGAGTGDLLFTTERGNRPVDANNFRTWVWSRLVADCGLDPAPTPHDMRHGHAGVMVMQGMDWKVLADRLGHHKPSFTADRYGWIRPDHAAVSVAAIERAMAR